MAGAEGGGELGALAERGGPVGEPGPHPDHIDLLASEEEEVIGQLLARLTGQANHHAGADLVTERA